MAPPVVYNFEDCFKALPIEVLKCKWFVKRGNFLTPGHLLNLWTFSPEDKQQHGGTVYSVKKRRNNLDILCLYNRKVVRNEISVSKLSIESLDDDLKDDLVKALNGKTVSPVSLCAHSC